MGMSMVLSGLMRASGTVLVPTALSMLAIGGIQVPLAWLLSRRCDLNGIWAVHAPQRPTAAVRLAPQPSFPWHCLYLSPDPQGQGSFRDTLVQLREPRSKSGRQTGKPSPR